MFSWKDDQFCKRTTWVTDKVPIKISWQGFGAKNVEQSVNAPAPLKLKRAQLSRILRYLGKLNDFSV